MTLTARPTTYNGIAMRSRLEATFAGFLDRYGFDWEYEPRAFGSASGQYLPDFRVDGFMGPGGLPTYVEVKGSSADAPAARDRMAIIRNSEPGAWLALLCADQMEATREASATADGSHWIAAKLGYYRCKSVVLSPFVDGTLRPVCECGECAFPLAILDPFTRLTR